jgi:hypothetical protein
LQFSGETYTRYRWQLTATEPLIEVTLHMENQTSNSTDKKATIDAPIHIIKGIDVKFVFTESKAKAGKEATQYWKVDMTQFVPDVDPKLEGDALAIARENARVDFYTAVEKLVGGFDALVTEIDSRLNVGVKASQLEQGKDIYDKVAKLGYATEYVNNDFGATSKVGGGLANAINNLKAEKAEMGALLSEMNAMFGKYAAAPAKDKGAIMAEILKMQDRMAKYAAESKPTA